MSSSYEFSGEQVVYRTGKDLSRFAGPALLAGIPVALLRMKYASGATLLLPLPEGLLPARLAPAAGWCEWGLLAAAALAGLLWLTNVLSYKFVVTDKKFYIMKSSDRGHFVGLGEITYADLARRAFPRRDCSPNDILIETPKGGFLVRHVATPKHLLEALRDARRALCGAGPAMETRPAGKEETAGKAAPAATQQPSRSPLQELDRLVGLASVKKEVVSLCNFVTVQRMREEAGQTRADLNLHTVFTGNPGTGKTTVARIIGRIYKEAGILNGGQVIETDRSGLVADYVGQTAGKTNAVVDRALGGVLFIDEAYALTEGGPADYGREAVTTLIKRMEDDRGRFVVILAGYTGRMQLFLESNPGLKSRFPRVIDFPDYSAGELLEIFCRMAADNGYRLTSEAVLAAGRRIRDAVGAKGPGFGNARFVRNLFERTIQNQADRIMGSIYGSEETSLITDTDIA